MDSYWDLYVAYVHHCVEYNKKHDIDPHHYKMEWNHFLPQCIFGDQPIGHYLLLKQHAIASALQTLAFKRNCLCGWHKKYLPPALMELSWSYFRAHALKRNAAIHSEKDELGRSVLGVQNAERLNLKKDDLGRSVNAVKGSIELHRIIHAKKDGRGKSVRGVKAGELLHSKKDELGRSVVAMRTNKQVWESTVDGFRSHSGGVAQHNKRNGWDPAARVRIA